MKLAYCHTDRNTQLHRNGYQPRALYLVLKRLHEKLSESTKDNIRSRIASTIQSALQHGSNSTKDEQHALKRLKNDEDIVILPADRGRVTVIMDKTDYHD